MTLHRVCSRHFTVLLATAAAICDFTKQLFWSRWNQVRMHIRWHIQFDILPSRPISFARGIRSQDSQVREFRESAVLVTCSYLQTQLNSGEFKKGEAASPPHWLNLSYNQIKILYRNALFLHKILIFRFGERAQSPPLSNILYPFAPYSKILDSPLPPIDT